MTTIEIAIEALTQFADPNNWSLKPGCLQWTGKRNAIEYAESIVAALTAEPSPVPPDREREAIAAALDGDHTSLADRIIAGRKAAALLRRLALPAVGDWRDIASAPKDGTRILVYGPKWDEGDATVHVDLWKEGSWWKSLKGQQPTHWQPLPAPPIPEEPKPSLLSEGGGE